MSEPDPTLMMAALFKDNSTHIHFSSAEQNIINFSIVC